MVFTEYTKKRILFYHAKGHHAPKIAKLLEEEGVVVSRRGVHAFLVRVQQTGDIARRPGNGRRSKRTDEVKEVVETAMRADDETTAKELQAKLTDAGNPNTQAVVVFVVFPVFPCVRRKRRQACSIAGQHLDFHSMSKAKGECQKLGNVRKTTFFNLNISSFGKAG